jgi:hypothetical protein
LTKKSKICGKTRSSLPVEKESGVPPPVHMDDARQAEQSRDRKRRFVIEGQGQLPAGFPAAA